MPENNNDYPFPPMPVTAEVVKEQIALGGWSATTCHLCRGENAASWQIDGLDSRRVICARCQRYVITGPTVAGLRVAEENDSAAGRAHRIELATQSARSADVFRVP